MVIFLMKLMIKFPQPSRTLRTLKAWGEDDGMIQDTYSVTQRLVNGEVVGQFSLIQLATFDNDGRFIGWGANQEASKLSNGDLNRIAQMQVPDEFGLDAKMQWLTNGGNGEWGSPLKATYPPGPASWRQADKIFQINAVYAGQQVQVIETDTKTITFNGKRETVPMSRIATFNRVTDWGYTWQSHPWLVHKVTMADKNDRYGERPKGIIYLPLITKTANVWIMDRWLR